MESQKSKSLWSHAWESLVKDRFALVSMIIIFVYTVVAICASQGWMAADWNKGIGEQFLAPSLKSFDLLFGTDIFGRSVLAKTIKGTQIAMSIGLFTAVISTVIGVVLGAIAGYFGGKVDEVIVWFYTTFASIPGIMKLVAIAFILGKGLLAVYLALGLSNWVHLCRLVRGEVIRHKDREYVQAADAIGGGHYRKLFKHILPNVFHIVIIQFSLQFQTAIKSEVILSYLGLGAQGMPSWGTMINDSKLELAQNHWWQLAAATFAMLIVVLAFNILGDALRDALDPKLKGK